MLLPHQVWQSLFLSLILAVKFLKHIGLLVLLAHAVPVRAQEEKYLDDTPRDVYNPTTTLFTNQEAIQYHLGEYQSIADDTSIKGIHRFTFLQQHGNKLQDLGSNGTAVKPIFYILPQQIGTTSGFHAYDLYFRSPQQFRYYDTKSPYTRLHAALARFFYTVTDHFVDICHSRNVTPHWNVGFNFRDILTDKEWISTTSEGDSNVISYGLDFFTHYKTDNDQYQLLAHFLFMKHRVRETGGIFTLKYVNDKASLPEKILFQGPHNRLLAGGKDDRVESSDLRKRLHLYHQLGIREQIWAYHELGIEKKRHLFKVDRLYKNSKIFLGGRPDNDQSTIEAKTTEWSAHNELGLKGDRQGLFYSGYYHHKMLELKHKEPTDQLNLHEHYVGMRARYHLANKPDFLHLSGEYLFQGGYKACAGYQGQIFDLALERVSYQPSFLTQRYSGYHRQWRHHFALPAATQLRGGVKLDSKVLQLRPQASFTRVNKHIYFRHVSDDVWQQQKTMVARPQQDNGYADMITWGTDLNLALGPYIHWDNELTVAHVLGPSARLFHVPKFLINSRLYYTSTTTEGNGTMEAGLDAHWKSSYKADAYDPVTQQFYWQDTFHVYSYPVLDLFLNFRIKYLSMFLKFSHWNEGLSASPGYFVTPFYPGQRRTWDVGLTWSFFD